MQDLFSLEGTVALVTGAGRGIGKAIALGLARYGADLVLCSRTQEELDRTARAARLEGRRAVALSCDLRNLDQHAHLLDEALQAFGRLDTLVNNAGALLVSPALDVDEAAWDLVMELNVKAPFFLSQRVGRIMIKQGRGGSIINVTSEVVERAEVDLGAYCPSKAALHSITKALAREWGPFGIRVNSLAPCFVDTALNEPLFAQRETFYEPKLQQVPLGRHSVPEDLVGAAVFLASAASSYISGTTFLVDGGLTA